MPQRKGNPDFVLLMAILLLIATGIVMVFSSSSVAAYLEFGDALYYLKRQLLWIVVGLAAMVVLVRVDYTLWKRWAGPITLVSFLLLIMVLVIGISVKGASRWLEFGGLRLQPSEIIKLTMVLFMAHSLSKRQDQLQSFMRGVLPYLVILGAACALILAQPDLGTAVALAGTTYLLFLAAGANWIHLFGMAVAGLAVVSAAIATAPYRMARFTAFLDPWADPSDSGFQTIQSLLALGSGGLFGMGLGQGRQKFLYLPERHTDFIYAILGEEMGLLGAIGVLMLFFLLLWRGYRVALAAPDTFGSLAAVGITSMISLQAVINIGVVTGSLPVTGITLPLVSYGGSSLLFTLAALGILLNISRYSRG